MAFFNSKEEVIDIELTSYGKILLSRGAWKPVYYSFHDDDILYDSSYALVTEISSNSESRIQEQTPYLKTLYSFVSPTPNLEKNVDQEKFLDSIINFEKNKVDKYSNSIGDSSISNLYIPSWKILNLSTVFDSITPTFTNKNLNIPQLNCELSSSFVRTTQEYLDKNPEVESLIDRFNSFTIDENNIHFFTSEEILLKIEEKNIDIEQDIFDIEIFKVSKDKNNNDVYEPIKFLKEPKTIDENDFLQDLKTSSQQEINDTYVENYFNFSLDREIDNVKVCKYILKTTDDQDQIFNDISICDNLDNTLRTNDLYRIVIDRATGKNC